MTNGTVKAPVSDPLPAIATAMTPLLLLSHSHGALTPFNAFRSPLSANDNESASDNARAGDNASAMDGDAQSRHGAVSSDTVSDGPLPRGALGKPVWGRAQLVSDLELRLGLPAFSGGQQSEQSRETSRVLAWAARMQALVDGKPFYAASFSVDPLGTARTVLAWRDALRSCAWQGNAIPNGGPRLDAIAALEAQHAPVMPPNLQDRALHVASALAERRHPVYPELYLGDVEGAWPPCFQRVFAALRSSGTVIHVLEPALPQAPAHSDLGKLQRALDSDAACQPVTLTGDGSIVLIDCETSVEGAQCAAAIVASWDSPTSVVIRGSEEHLLARALEIQQLPSQGLYGSSPWRAALQVLPLALELAFEPKDPQRVLELLNIPGGPFAGVVGRHLTRALLRSPGVGGRAWQEAKRKLQELGPERVPEGSLDALTTWLETRGADPVRGAPRAELLDVVSRVHVWLASRLVETVTHPNLHSTVRTAAEQCDQLTAALALDSRDVWDLVHVRRVVEFVMSSGAALELEAESVGRVPAVSSATALRAPVSNLLWWMFTHDYEFPVTVPWRAHERAALSAAGIALPDLALQLSHRAASLRRSVFCVRDKLILIAPRTSAGEPRAPHPLWDELVARCGLDTRSRALITCTADALLRRESLPIQLPQVEPQVISPLPLPKAHGTWKVELQKPIAFERYSASSLSSLLGCQLQWALTSLAGLSSEEQALSSQHLLNGMLGHRLIEELYAAGAFDAGAEDFQIRAEAVLTDLIEGEGAVLLRPGKAHELSQIRRQLVKAACRLQKLLTEGGLRIVSLEESFEAPWRSGVLFGRWDLLVEDENAQRLVIDVKWGYRKYADQLKRGKALQLAAYGHALRKDAADVIPAAYYALSPPRLLGTSASVPNVEHVSGPSLEHTWARIERTLPMVEKRVASGVFRMNGPRALPLLDDLGVPEAERETHYDIVPQEACEYCRFPTLCGKRWEGYS